MKALEKFLEVVWVGPDKFSASDRLKKSDDSKLINCQKVGSDKKMTLSTPPLERGDFQFFFRIFVAFGPNTPMTIRFNLLCFKMFVSVWKTCHTNPVVREQPNFNLFNPISQGVSISLPPRWGGI